MTNQITNFMVQIPFWEAGSLSAVQEITRLLRDSKFF